MATALEEQQHPLLEAQPQPAPKPSKTSGQKAIRKTFKISAHLSNLLPTGSVLAFQILSPVFTHEGQCRSVVSQSLTLALLALCGISSFLLCFTDSFRDDRGKVRYGLATFGGLRVIDGTVTLPPEEAAKYRLRFADFFHGFLSVVVFASVALFNQNVVKCFYPSPSEEAQELLATLPVGTGVVCSLLFICFPSNRHGIGFPLSRH
ncbi:protein DMP7 [Diospyros lotus]|uniref:protein DMP7 n=1 Tax=Diospyros lotus TaxID=55363 RepID=UPI00224D3E63|nr:protein DMP7 [Diospyros lotus]